MHYIFIITTPCIIIKHVENLNETIYTSARQNVKPYEEKPREQKSRTVT